MEAKVEEVVQSLGGRPDWRAAAIIKDQELLAVDAAAGADALHQTGLRLAAADGRRVIRGVFECQALERGPVSRRRALTLFVVDWSRCPGANRALISGLWCG